MDIVERLRDWNKFGVSRGDFVAYSQEAADEIERLRNAIKVQANAVRVLHEAETSELNRLRKNAQEAYTAKATLDSEREANKILTDEIERLQKNFTHAATIAKTAWLTESCGTIGDAEYGSELCQIISDKISAIQQKEKE